MKKVLLSVKQTQQKHRWQKMRRLNLLFQRCVLFIVKKTPKTIHQMRLLKKMEQVFWFHVQSVVYGFMQVNNLIVLLAEMQFQILLYW